MVDTQFLGSSLVEGKSKGRGYDDYGKDEDIQGYEYESGDNAAMIDEIEEEAKYQHRKAGGGGGGGGSGRPSSAMGAATSDGRGASNGGGLVAGIDDGATAEKERTKSTPGETGGGKAPMSKTAAAKMKKLSTKDRLKKKLGL